MPMRNLRQFYCPECGYIRTLLDGEPDIVDCPACSHQRIYKQVPQPEYPWTVPVVPNFQEIPLPAFDMVDPCAGCHNNPKNGGSGICHCTIPYLRGPGRITC